MASQFVEDEIKNNRIVVFSKTYCPYCKMAKTALNDVTKDYVVHELENRKDGKEIQSYLAKKTGASTVPRVFIDGNCIGGGTETKTLKNSGKLQQMLEQPRKVE